MAVICVGSGSRFSGPQWVEPTVAPGRPLVPGAGLWPSTVSRSPHNGSTTDLELLGHSATPVPKARGLPLGAYGLVAGNLSKRTLLSLSWCPSWYVRKAVTGSQLGTESRSGPSQDALPALPRVDGVLP